MIDDLPPSCAALAAQLIVEGCLPIIQGTVKGQMPIEAVRLTPGERGKLGLKPGGLTLFYPAGQDGVFFDGESSSFTIWFSGDECVKATEALHGALMRAFPTTKQLDDVIDKADPRLRARVYRVDLGGGILAAIQTSFTRGSAGKVKFQAHVIAQQRKR